MAISSTGRSVRSTLLAMMVALTIPVTALTIFVLVRHAFEQQTRYAGQAEQTAAFVSQIIDQQLSNLGSLLEGAASSTALQGGDLETFYREAQRVVDGTDYIIVLRDRARRQLLNTAVPFGHELPPAPPIRAEEATAFDEGRVVVGGLYASPINGELRVPVALPLTIDGEQLVLAVTVPAAFIHSVIASAAPKGWVVTVGDATGLVVARTLDNDRYAGKPALPAYLERATGPSGSFRITGFGGAELLTGYARSKLSGWLTGANIPVNVVEAPLWTSLGSIAAVALGAAVAAFGIGAAFIRRFQTASQALLEEASRMSSDDRPGKGTGLLEFDRAIASLAEARARRFDAEVSLRERTQELEAVLDTAPAAVWFTYDPAVMHVKSNAHANRILRISADSQLSIASGRLTHLQVFKDGAPCPNDALPLDRAFRGEHLRDEEYVFRFDDGSEITLLVSAEPLYDVAGNIIGSIAVGIDISERKRNEERQYLLINELNHRVKNTLTTVQSIARRTLRTADTLREAESALVDRLVAVSKAYDVLTREHWEGSTVRAMIESSIGGYAQAGRVRVEGPDVLLNPSNSVTLSLIIHELAVNATKYGALAEDLGRVDVTWTLENVNHYALVRLEWVESGGPTVTQPKRRGFGSDLLTRLSESSEQWMDFRPSGLVCTFSLRQSNIAQP